MAKSKEKSEEKDNFRLVDRPKYYTLQVLGPGDSKPDENFDEQVQKLLKEPKHTVVNCASNDTLSDEWIESLQFLSQQMAGFRKQLYVVFAPKAVAPKMSQPKAGKPLDLYPGLYEALKNLSDSEDKLRLKKVHFIKAFIDSTLRTFYIQSKTRTKRGEIYIKTDHQDKLLGDVSGIIKITSDSMSYLMMVSFPAKTFLRLASRLLEKDVMEITEEVQEDTIELLNHILKQASIVVDHEESGVKVHKPAVADSKDFPEDHAHELIDDPSLLDKGKTVVTPYESSLGDFFFELWFPEEFKPSMLK